MVQLKVASMFFFSGLAVVIALVVVVYVVAWVYDRAAGSPASSLTPTELEERRVASTLVKAAGLAGLLPDENDRIMRHFFQQSSAVCVKKYSSGDIEAPKSIPKARKDGDDDERSGGARKENRKTFSNGIQKAETLMTTDSKSENDSNTDKLTNKSQCSKGIETNCTNGKTSKSKSKQKNVCNCCRDSSALNPSRKIVHSLAINKDLKNGERNGKGKLKRQGGGKGKKSAGVEAEKEAEGGGCPICLVEFVDGENILIGSSCGHEFHFECFMQWVEKNHTDCPLCRSEMMTPKDFLASAYEVLGEQRVDKLQLINEEAARRLTAFEANENGGGILEESSSSEPVNPLVGRDPPARLAPPPTDDTSRLTVAMVE